MWDSLDETHRGRLIDALQTEMPRAALTRYEDSFRRLATEFPEVAFWANLVDHQATRAEIRSVKHGLVAIEQVLTEIATGRRPDGRRRALAKAYQAGHKWLANDLFCAYVGAAKRVTILNTWIPNLDVLDDSLEAAARRGAEVRIMLLHPKSMVARLRTDALREGGRRAVRRPQLVASRPTQATVDTIAGTMAMICDAGAAEHANVELLTILRFWGEVLVSVEYGELWPRMEPVLQRSVFYHPHYVHDAKSRPLAAASPLSLTHSDQLGMRLSQLTESAGARQSFVRVEEAILKVKTGFYDQFRHAVS